MTGGNPTGVDGPTWVQAVSRAAAARGRGRGMGVIGGLLARTVGVASSRGMRRFWWGARWGG